MKEIVHEDSFLNQKNYKKTKLYINKFPIAFLIIFFATIISIFSTNKEEKIKIDKIKKRRESIINKKIKTYSNKETRETIKNKQSRAYSIDKDLNEEYKDIQKYIDMSMNATLYNPNEVFKKLENPKISIVITVYNGEGYLKTTLLSIQNQDFKDIEIIFVDDCSKDNSVNLIKELMIKDPRIKLYKNEQNKGMLYTKTRGILHAKGKYVMLLDVDDIYAQRDAFSTLYQEAEENNLDILGFSMLAYRIDLRKWLYIKKYIKTDVIYKSKVYSIMYKCNSLYCRRRGCATACYFFRTNIFIDIIKPNR